MATAPPNEQMPAYREAPPPYTPNPYPPAPPKVETHYVIPVQTVTVASAAVGPRPTNITCPSCHHAIHTRVTYESNTRTHMIALLMCIFVCWPCCLFPYCMDSCKTANHYCPNCQAYVGAYTS